MLLGEALELAHKQNSEVHLAHLKVNESDAKVTQARADYFPRVTNETNGLHLGEKERLTIPQGSLGTYPADGAIPGKDVTIDLGKQNLIVSTTTAAQPLSQLLKVHAGVQVARADAAIARADAKRAEDEIALNVKKLYFSILAMEKRAAAARLRIQAGEEKIEEARNAVAAGAGLEVDVRSGEAEIAEARNALGTLEDALADARIELNDLLGLPLDTELELLAPAGDEPATETMEHSFTAASTNLANTALVTNAFAHNPELASAQTTLIKANAGLKAAKLEFVPDVSLFVEHVYQNGVPLLPENSYTAGVRVEWTLSEFGKRTGLIRERSAQVEQASTNLGIVEDRTRMDIAKARRKLDRSSTALAAAQAAVDARAESRRVMSNQVEAKTANPSALSDADAKLDEAQAQLLQTQMARAIADAELERLSGDE